MTAPNIVQELVSRFGDQREAYKSAGYKEAQLRIEFVDPLFVALGWDVSNTKGLSLTAREVVHEDSLDVAGSKRAPDYSFRIGGERKYFLEAKKPSVNVGSDPSPAFQIRRYAWSAKLPISTLTDFEEFALYDCLSEPSPTDSAGVGRISLLGFEEFDDRWSELEDLLSFEAVQSGSLDKYAESLRTSRGTSEVDEVFLGELEGWRSQLAKDMASRNPALTQRQLNFAVQQTIDRVVFLRIAEDRGIEPYGQLEGLLGDPGIYGRLKRLFRNADDRYNSGLFHFRTEAGRPEDPDNITLDLEVGDKVLESMFARLYYPNPYEFSVLPAAILGHIYEQFLGKVIRLTPSHVAKIEEKPEVRKAGGVYYTPKPIVDFIVESTLGPQVEGRTTTQVSGQGRAKDRHPFRVIDPACGSGSFLLVAYDYLLRWYLEQYIANDPAKWERGRTPRLRRGKSGDWFLTSSEKKEILLRHLFGVDIDTQAVEVTKLSLLLKVLEGESAEVLQSQLSLFHERALPDLGRNIKCGNSLIESDFQSQSQLGVLDEEKQLRVNVFDWEDEFPDVFAHGGGFDAAIGNPPYLDSETMTRFTPEWRPYCVSKYQSATGNWDIFCVFVERALSLCRMGGRHSYIIPNKLGSANYASETRKLIADDNDLVSVRDYSSVPVFPVAVYPIVYTVSRSDRVDSRPVAYERMVRTEEGMTVTSESLQLDRKRYFPVGGGPWGIFATLDEGSPVARLKATFDPLSTIASVHGASTVSEAYQFAEIIEDASPGVDYRLRVVNSGTIDRYADLWGKKRMRYLGSSYDRPIVSLSMEEELPKNRLSQASSPKIIVAGMTKILECIGDFEGTILPGKSTTVIETEVDMYWLLGILNSDLVSHYYVSEFGGDRLQGGYLRIGPPQIKKIPIPPYKTGNPANSALSSRVKTLLEVHIRRTEVATPHERTSAERTIKTLEDQVNTMVADLYGLSEIERGTLSQGD